MLAAPRCPQTSRLASEPTRPPTASAARPLAFTIAGYDVECIRSFNARKVAKATEAKKRR